MTQLEDIFEELGLTQYLDSFLEQGFDTWETCLDIRESDLYVSAELAHVCALSLTGTQRCTQRETGSQKS